jgi:hypothetical protein
MDHASKHLVIGAGFSGLGVAAAFTRRGIPFDLVEADDDVGGNWYHGVYENVHIISSRKTTEYTDYPMPASYPDFPSARQMLDYLRSYAEHYDLRAHLELRTKVALVSPAPEGRWEVRFESGETRLYGGVVVCNGHHWDKRYPSYPGELTVPLLHSKDYKSGKELEGKRVLVLGGGNSACDIAVEAARVGAASHISMRRGYWFMPKSIFGVPTAELMKPWMPLSMQRAVLKSLLRVVVGRYEDYGLMAPDHEPFEHHPTINTELLHYLQHGRITPHPDVAAWEGNTVRFSDGKRLEVDLVVAATGYHVSFPFVAPGVVRFVDGMPELYGGMTPPHHANLYVFGVGQPRYGAGPLISAGADVLCTMVETQKRLRNPLGAVLKRMGDRPAKSYLVDPFQVLRAARQGQRVIPRLPYLEGWLMRKKRPPRETKSEPHGASTARVD